MPWCSKASRNSTISKLPKIAFSENGQPQRYERNVELSQRVIASGSSHDSGDLLQSPSTSTARKERHEEFVVRVVSVRHRGDCRRHDFCVANDCRFCRA
jgi:hypothetical protein